MKVFGIRIISRKIGRLISALVLTALLAGGAHAHAKPNCWSRFASLKKIGEVSAKENLKNFLAFLAKPRQIPRPSVQRYFEWTPPPPRYIPYNPVGAWEIAKKAAQKYWDEFRIVGDDEKLHFSASRWHRLLVKPRTQGETHTPLQYTVAISMNPIATIFNRPRQLTIPASMLAAYLLIDYPADFFAAEVDKVESDRAAEVLANDTVPGASYIFSLLEDGFLDREETLPLLNGHLNTLARWSSHPYDRGNLLPRVAELYRARLLSDAELPLFEKLLRKVYGSTLRTIVREEEAFEKAKLAGEKPAPPNSNLPGLLLENLKQALLAENSPFAHRTVFDREQALASAFWPVAKAGRFSDLELQKKIVEADDEKNPLGAVHRLLKDRRISIGEALRLAAEAETHPLKMRAQLEARAREAALVLPASVAEIFRRPEPARYRQEQHFDGQKLNSEIDHWKVLLGDPRFGFVKSLVDEKKITPEAAFEGFEIQMRSLQQLYDLDSAYGTKPFDKPALQKLFDFEGGHGNALFLETKTAIAQLAQANPEMPEGRILRCFSAAGEFWRRFYVDEARLARAKPTMEIFQKQHAEIVEERKPQYEKILGQCERGFDESGEKP